jgi:hypothetical protein
MGIETPEVKAGATTTENAVAKSSSVWGIVAMVLGVLTSIGATIAASFGANTTAGIIVGAVVAFCGIAQKTLTDLGYISSRTAVKTAASKAGE